MSDEILTVNEEVEWDVRKSLPLPWVLQFSETLSDLAGAPESPDIDYVRAGYELAVAGYLAGDRWGSTGEKGAQYCIRVAIERFCWDEQYLVREAYELMKELIEKWHLGEPLEGRKRQEA